MRVVTAYRPFPAESREHQELGPFDWVGAIEMLRVSVQQSCDCETVAITDLDTVLPGPTFHYRTHERRLMLWILDVSLRYLQGAEFDRDTVFCSPDQLVFQDLSRWFAGECGFVIRPMHKERPILNALQWWPLKGREKLIVLYEQALQRAHQLPEAIKTWGADSVPFERLLKPLRVGMAEKKSGILANLIDSRQVMVPLTSDVIDALEKGQQIHPRGAVVDFRYTRKKFMRAYFDATIGAVAA